MDLEKCFVIMGYNNTRINDVKIIREVALNNFDAKVVLFKEEIINQDKEVADYYMQLDLLSNNIDKTIEFLELNNLEVIGVLPFSDKGVPIGAKLAEKLNLFHDASGMQAEACIDKEVFRKLEEKFNAPDWYKKVGYKKVYNREEAEDVLLQYGKMFMKPAAEGNSRGCMEIHSKENLSEWCDRFGVYFKDGVLCEELIDGEQEYSYDSLGNLEWITEKSTTEGLFKGEYNHISPAPLSKDLYDRLIEAGRIVKNIVGSNNGANHHEFFINKDGSISCVEPNRRPAGGKVFSFGNVLYRNAIENVWVRWLEIMSGKEITDTDVEMEKDVVGFRFVRSFKNKTIDASNDLSELESFINENFHNKIIEYNLIVSVGDKVTKDIITNADFIGGILLKDSSYEEVLVNLDSIENKINELI
ncbi:ATP-grasp domain-containing protein [Bacillus thuringiensis]|uniref:ATP-grasp domain-containing protein n=1 Tax=Bacillus thuringiensis TaxID=1428 RepID=UPI003CE6F34B